MALSKKKPENLVMALKPVEGDDTFKVVVPKLRFDFKMTDAGWGIQILFDLINKFQKGKSKPIAYFTYSTNSQALEIVKLALASAVVLGRRNQKMIEMGEIISDLQGIFNLIKDDARNASVVAFKAVGKDVK